MIYQLKLMNMKFMNWKTIIRTNLVLGLILMIAGATYAQPAPNREKLESARIALITKRLNLEPETAQRFWPVYNQVKEEERELRKGEMEMRRNLDPAQLSDDQAQAKLDEYFVLKDKLLELERKSAQQYQDVISHRQILLLYKAEGDFRRMVLDKVSKRRPREGRREGRP